MTLLGRIPEWVNRYVGVQYEDEENPNQRRFCWTLIQDVLENEFGKSLPDYGNVDSGSATADWVEEEIARTDFYEVPLNELQPGDILWFVGAVVPRAQLHVGVVVNEFMFLHALPDAGVVLQPIFSEPYIHQLRGVYRYKPEEEKLEHDV